MKKSEETETQKAGQLQLKYPTPATPSLLSLQINSCSAETCYSASENNSTIAVPLKVVVLQVKTIVQ